MTTFVIWEFRHFVIWENLYLCMISLILLFFSFPSSSFNSSLPPYVQKLWFHFIILFSFFFFCPFFLFFSPLLSSPSLSNIFFLFQNIYHTFRSSVSDTIETMPYLHIRVNMYQSASIYLEMSKVHPSLCLCSTSLYYKTTSLSVYQLMGICAISIV